MTGIANMTWGKSDISAVRVIAGKKTKQRKNYVKVL